MITRNLLTLALMAITFVATARKEGKTQKTIGFDVNNVSLGIAPSLTGKPVPTNFSFDEFADYQGTLLDIGLSANIYGRWNLRGQIGYLAGALNPEDYFDQVLPFEQVDGVYDDVNGYEEAWSLNGIIPESYIMFNIGVSRTFAAGKMNITPYLSSWYSNERPRIIVDGYEVIATGEYVDETVLAYEDWGVTFYPTIGVDIEFNQYVFGLSFNDGDSPMPLLGLRIGYSL
jgi:hypothetical protein